MHSIYTGWYSPADLIYEKLALNGMPLAGPLFCLGRVCIINVCSIADLNTLLNALRYLGSHSAVECVWEGLLNHSWCGGKVGAVGVLPSKMGTCRIRKW